MSHLTINVLGSFKISIDDTPIVALESTKVRALIAYLAVESNRAHSRETLVGLLWPETSEGNARHNLRQALFNLRSALGDHAANPPYLLITRDTIQFNRESDYCLDFDQFNQRYSACADELNQPINDSPRLTSDLEDMAQLYRGEFLHQFFVDDSNEFEEWCLVLRENLHQRALEAHSYLANYYQVHGNFQSARRHASRLLALDPWREEAHRQLMRLLALDGERSAALAQYETCRRVLADELDVEPSIETRELYDQIRLGTLTPKTLQPAGAPAIPVKNLPVQLTPFIGREVELEQLGQLIGGPECRLINLVGPGGIGKTRLAIQAAEKYFDAFADGAAFVPLAAVGSTIGVIPAIVDAINVNFYGASDPKAQLVSYLSEKQLLMIFDNVEHLIFPGSQDENITQLMIELLQRCPGIKLLATSREALKLQGEWIFDLHGLNCPDVIQEEGYDEYDAVALFVQRARRVLPNFKLSPQNRREVARICHLVDGMPLAIELATTWMRTLSLTDIALEIEKSLDFLTTSMADLPERHRSMRAVFDYSWQMLSKDEQQVLSKLSVFRGGFQRQAAEQVASATLSILSTLVNRTLLRLTSAGRYDLHELVRQYSADQLEADPEAKSAVQGKHCDFYLSMAESANKELQGRNQLEWLTRLEQEQDNLRKALECTVKSESEESECNMLALKLCAALRWYWRMRGHFHEGCNWLTQSLQRFPEARNATRAGALLGLGLLLNGLGELGAAHPHLQESVSIFRELELKDGLAEALMIEGLTHLWQGEADSGQTYTREALELYRQIGDRWGEAQALYRLGSYLADYGGASIGKTMLEESASILETFGERYLYTSVLVALGIADMKLGNYAAAQLRFENGLNASREIRHPWGIADVLTNLGCLYRIKGDYITAQTHFNEALMVYQEHGRNVWETDVLCAMAENDIQQGDFSNARQHLQAATNLLGTSKNQLLQTLVWYLRGLLDYYVGETEQAAALLEETVRLAQEGQFKPDLARALLALGRVRLTQGKDTAAFELMCESLAVYRDISYKLGYALVIEALAIVSFARGDATQAVKLFSASSSLRDDMKAPLPPVDRSVIDSAVANCQEYLGVPVFTELWERDAERPIEAVVQEILSSPG